VNIVGLDFESFLAYLEDPEENLGTRMMRQDAERTVDAAPAATAR
jgi:hypothetical protein